MPESAPNIGRSDWRRRTEEGNPGPTIVDAWVASQIVEIGLREAVGIAGEVKRPAAIAGADFRSVGVPSGWLTAALFTA
jgi:hypothetical protein